MERGPFNSLLVPVRSVTTVATIPICIAEMVLTTRVIILIHTTAVEISSLVVPVMIR
jgi:hypothetical protein